MKILRQIGPQSLLHNCASIILNSPTGKKLNGKKNHTLAFQLFFKIHPNICYEFYCAEQNKLHTINSFIRSLGSDKRKLGAVMHQRAT